MDDAVTARRPQRERGECNHVAICASSENTLSNAGLAFLIVPIGAIISNNDLSIFFIRLLDLIGTRFQIAPLPVRDLGLPSQKNARSNF